MPTYKGYFKPLNPSKYRGNPTQIIYRSRWECVYMSRLDKDPDVIWWQSEEVIIPYKSPVDGRYHRYFPDFVVCRKTKTGKKTVLVEIKPKSQTLPPKAPKSKRITRSFREAVLTYGVNMAKWEAAQEWCDDRGYAFEILTENELGLKF